MRWPNCAPPNPERLDGAEHGQSLPVIPALAPVFPAKTRAKAPNNDGARQLPTAAGRVGSQRRRGALAPDMGKEKAARRRGGLENRMETARLDAGKAR